ncbi:MAG: signal peptidase I [Clostridia bacterium]|nr:signal peptidase I [Oscillospiraceae bacterium]MBQ7032535.1 signal peptidase I [Clostridia bacterium]
MKKTIGREILEWVACLAAAVLITALLRNFVFTIVRVDGSSMEPTLYNNERLVMIRLGYEPEAGDIVVVDVSDKENISKQDKEKKRYIKRIIGMPGDVLRFEEAEGRIVVLRNGALLEETYISSDVYSTMDMVLGTDYTVPEDFVFVMGDNRPRSADSRTKSVGYIHVDNVLGKAAFRFWPLNKIGTP